MPLHDDDTGRSDSLDSVLAELKRGKVAPCYLLCGDEEFRLRDALERITTLLIPDAQDRELNLFVTDGEHEDVDGLCESLTMPPLLPGRKVIVVRDTRLFQSKTSLAPLIGRIRERLDQDPARAAAGGRSTTIRGSGSFRTTAVRGGRHGFQKLLSSA
jgi:DNA polymerase-3 subunit delta